MVGASREREREQSEPERERLVEISFATSTHALFSWQPHFTRGLLSDDTPNDRLCSRPRTITCQQRHTPTPCQLREGERKNQRGGNLPIGILGNVLTMPKRSTFPGLQILLTEASGLDIGLRHGDISVIRHGLHNCTTIQLFLARVALLQSDL